MDDNEVRKLSRAVLQEGDPEDLEFSLAFAKERRELIRLELQKLRTEFRMQRFLRDDKKLKTIHEETVKLRKMIDWLDRDIARMEKKQEEPETDDPGEETQSQ